MSETWGVSTQQDYSRTSYKKGVDTEMQILKYFFSRGYECLHQRLRTPFGELDLVLSKDAEILFVEVKYRKSMGEAQIALRQTQKKRIFRSAEWFMKCTDRLYVKSTICVALVSKTRVKLYPNVCLEGYDTL